MGRGGWLTALGLAAALLCGGRALAADAPAPPPPVLAFEAIETIDYWRNTHGGVKIGDTTLNKLRLAGARAAVPHQRRKPERQSSW